jgi:hypothetical protein
MGWARARTPPSTSHEPNETGYNTTWLNPKRTPKAPARCGQQRPALPAWPLRLYRPARFSRPGPPCLAESRTSRCRCEERLRICNTARKKEKKQRFLSQRTLFFFPPPNKREREGDTKYRPGLTHERVVRADVGLALDDVEPGAPYPLLAQRARERVRVDERAARGVDEHGAGLHLAQKCGVDDVARGSAAGREDEEDVARACELVEVDAADRAQGRVLRRQRRLERGVARGGRVRGVDAVRYAEGCEARERRLRDAAEAEEADRARWRERARAQLRAGEEERGEVEVGPLFCAGAVCVNRGPLRRDPREEARG